MPRRLIALLASGVLAALVFGVRPGLVAQAQAQAPAVEPLASPAPSNSTEPQFTTDGTRTILSWLEPVGTRTTLKFAERTVDGWSPARIVASGTDFMVNSADVPSVRALGGAAMVAHWLQQNGPDPESYDLRLSWSSDGGQTWSTPVSPHHDGKETQHGFASLFPLPGDGLGVVWLDGRAIPEGAPEGVGNMALRASTFDRDRHQQREVVVDSRVCECCPTAAALTSEGAIVAYRNRSANEIRDIYVSRLAGGRWSPPILVHADNWRITGCPVNGPAISARGRDVAVAWFTARNDQGRAFVAFSHDAGRTFAPPVRLDDASALGRVGVQLLADGSAAATWVEFDRNQSQFRARIIQADGTRGASIGIAESSGTRVPRIAVSGDDLLFAWTATDNGEPRVQTARLHRPAPSR